MTARISLILGKTGAHRAPLQLRLFNFFTASMTAATDSPRIVDYPERSPSPSGRGSQVYPYLWASEAESMGLSPSRIKDGAHGDGEFHADLLFEQSAWKIQGRWTASRGVGRIKQLQFSAETSDQLSGAEAERGLA